MKRNVAPDLGRGRPIYGADYSLAGEKMRLEYTETGTTVRFDDKGTGRVCGKCQLCCKLLPIPEIELQKPAGVRCKYQKVGKGCTIYARRPVPCRTWACRWLADPGTAGMSRPDAAHYVVDMEEDYVEHQDDNTGERVKIGVVQVWVDPAFPDAHRDPHLRAYLARMADEFGVAAIIRYDSRRAFCLFAPRFAADGEWHEVTSTSIRARTEREAKVLELGTEDGETLQVTVRQ